MNHGPNVTYQWFFRDGATSNLKTIRHVYHAQGTYTVMCTANNGFCQDTVTKVITISHYINADFFTAVTLGSLPEDSICLGINLFASAALSYPQGFLAYAWDWGDGTSDPYSSNFATSHLYTNGGNYLIVLTIKDTLGCTDTAQQWVIVEDASSQNVVSSTTLACVGEPIMFDDMMSVMAGTINWDFADGSVLQGVHDSTHTWDEAGNYVVTLTTTYKICPSVVSVINIEMEDYPDVNLGADTSICPGITGSIYLSNILNPNRVMNWSTGEVTNNLTVVNPGRYWSQVASPKAGCSATVSIWVQRDCYINIPNSFSPNGDGLNDYFIPRELLSSGVKTFRMNIYNRWGENIFTTEIINGRGWDGRYNEKMQNMGVYVYVIDVEFNNKIKKSFKGTLTLMK